MNILITGGAGYIGSHTCVALLERGYDVVVADNFVNSDPSVLQRIREITKRDFYSYQIDVTDAEAVERVFQAHKIDGVIHFAGLKAVGESVQKPLQYYRNNLLSTMVLADLCIKYGVGKFVFSSSATVYGDQQVPLVETMPLRGTTNPYGETKAMCERILTDTVRAHSQLAVTLLRYFNPVGAHESGLIGESPRGIPNNLMPYITQVAKGKLQKLYVYGNDYPTVDGTGVRDYIHVVDLAEGHVAALEHLKEGVHVFNLGTGQGTSVLQLIHTFEQVNGIKIPYEIVDRRPGDVAESYADATKAQRELGWYARRGIEEMCRDAWRYEVNQSDE
jgi:UDP-glucose 4-epimerase